MALAQVLVFNKFHRAIAEIQPEVEMASWRLNNVGQAKIWLPWSDPKCTTDIVKPGNRLVLQFDDGLPDWGGVMDVPLSVQSGRTGITAYTAERILDWRVTAKGRYFDTQTPGYIFQTLLTEESNEYPLRIGIGSIYTGGTDRTLEYHYHDLLRRVQDLARLTGEDFAIIPSYTAGVLTLTANWYEQRGSDLSDTIWLVEDRNVTGEPQLDRQGPLHNRILLAGEGSTWGDDRITSVAQDVDSINAYDYREYSETQSVTEQATLDANAAALLAAYKQPYRALTLPGVVNLPPGEFGDYDIGDILTASLFLESEYWYFEDSVRVIAREWRPDNTCRLEVVAWDS